MRQIGYARVSTEDQHLELQLQALRAAGCIRIYRDHGVSGALDTRPGLDRMLARLRAGDELIVWRLDRLGRSLVHLVQLIEQLGQRGVRFRSLTEAIDTGSAGGRLVFHLMAAMAEFERSLISERTRAGLAAAKSRGRRLGRSPALIPEKAAEALTLLHAGMTAVAVASLFGVHDRTIRRIRDQAGVTHVTHHDSRPST